jgi:CO/xanthine dehydrogenase FAD-binding subunit
MVELQPSKLVVRVRFPSSAPRNAFVRDSRFRRLSASQVLVFMTWAIGLTILGFGAPIRIESTLHLW